MEHSSSSAIPSGNVLFILTLLRSPALLKLYFPKMAHSSLEMTLTLASKSSAEVVSEIQASNQEYFVIDSC